jgi:hypothetical protein
MLRYFPITGRLVLSDDTQDPPHVIFDTDDAFLAVKPSDVIVGSQVVPARTASSQGIDGNQNVVDIETTYLLAQIDIPGAKVVRGMMRSTWDSNPEPADNLWRQASGTHLDILDGVQLTSVPQSDTSGYARVATMGGYTFEVDGLGNLILRERVVMRARDPGGPPTTYNRARRQATISFRLLIGFFLNQDMAVYPAVAPLDIRYATPSGNNLTFSNLNAGYGFTGRRLVAIIHSLTTTVPTSVTIGGVAATKQSGNIVNGDDGRTTVWDATVPTGTTVTVAASRSGGIAAGEVELYGVGNISGDPVITSATNGGGNSLSLGVSVGANECAIVAANCENGGISGSAITFVDLSSVEWRLTAGQTRGGSGILRAGAGSVTAGAQWSGPTGGVLTPRKNLVAIKYST